MKNRTEKKMRKETRKMRKNKEMWEDPRQGEAGVPRHSEPEALHENRELSSKNLAGTSDASGRALGGLRNRSSAQHDAREKPTPLPPSNGGGKERSAKRRMGRGRKAAVAMIAVTMSAVLAVGIALPLTGGDITNLPISILADSPQVTSQVNGNIGLHSKWDYKTETIFGKDGDNKEIGAGYGPSSAGKNDYSTVFQQSEEYKPDGQNGVVFAITDPETAPQVWAKAIAYATDKERFSTKADSGVFEQYGDNAPDYNNGTDREYIGNYYAGKDHEGQYITVKLYCDWEAKDFYTLATYLDPLPYSESAPTAGGTVKKDTERASTSTAEFNVGNYSIPSYDVDYSTAPTIPEDKRRKPITGADSYELNANTYPNQGEHLTSFNYSLDPSALENRGNSVTLNNYGVYSDETNWQKERNETFYNVDVVKSGDYYVTYDMNGGQAAAVWKTSDGKDNDIYTPYSPFSYGRINVPRGAYIVLDLNGHTIDRGYGKEYDEETGNGFYHLNGSFGYKKFSDDNAEANDKARVNDRDGDVYGQVISVEAQARLEVMDSTATESANAARIDEVKQDTRTVQYTNIHNGTITGGKSVKYSWGLKDEATQDGWSHSADGRADYGAEAAAKERKLGCYFQNEQKGAGVKVYSMGEFILHSGQISLNNSGHYGGGLYALTRSSIILYDGYVLGNSAQAGGGFYLANGSAARFAMYGGVFAYNQTWENRKQGSVFDRMGGGGLCLNANNYIDIEGGEFAYNSSAYTSLNASYVATVPETNCPNGVGGIGGGIYIGNNCRGVMKNVVIRNNTAGMWGGGVFLYSTAQDFQFGGALQIYDNTELALQQQDGTTTGWHTYTKPSSDTDGAVSTPDKPHGQDYEMTNNMHLASNTSGSGVKINITDSLLKGGNAAKIGITLTNVWRGSSSGFGNEKNYGKDYGFTNGYATNNSADGQVINPAKYFFADNGKGVALNSKNEVKIGEETASLSNLIWKISGTNAQGEERSITLATLGSVTYYSISDDEKGESIPTLSVDSGILKFTFGDFTVDTVEAYEGTVTEEGGDTTYTQCGSTAQKTLKVTTTNPAVSSWKHTGKTVDSSNFATSFVLNKDLAAGTELEGEQLNDLGVSWAGNYGFSVDTGNNGKVYKNNNFNIFINPCGLNANVGTARNGEAADLYYKGAAYKNISEELSKAEDALRAALGGSVAQNNLGVTIETLVKALR